MHEATIAIVSTLFLISGLIILGAELRTGKKDKNLRQRYLSALVMAPLALLSIYQGGFTFILFVFIASAFCVKEFLSLVNVWNHLAYRIVAILSLIILMLGAAFEPLVLDAGGSFISLKLPDNDFHPFYAVLVPVVMLVLSVPILLRDYQGMVLRELTTIFSALYFGWFLYHLVLLRNLEGGLGLTIYFLIVVALNDVGAYTAGRLLGSHKLILEISPKKTWEGFLGGLLGSVLSAICLSSLLTSFSPLQALFCGLLVGSAAPFGDLVVSVIKRDMHKKDSSDLIPGHGGLLDRADSIIFCAPNFYYFVVLLRSFGS